VYRTFTRSAAVVLAVATAAILLQLSRADPRPISVLVVARAVTLAGLLHTGLFWAPDAVRNWQRVAAAAAMLPSAWIMTNMLGEAATRMARGHPVELLSATVAAAGVIVYSVAYVALARVRRAAA
jgi:hypothetical protein